MLFAREVHKEQKRKYTGNPYADHLAEVAGIVATVANERYGVSGVSQEDIVATAWLHDCIEDQEILPTYLEAEFGSVVARGVLMLSDLESEGNRATRKAAGRVRLAAAPGWVQSVKVADLISNTASIVMHDPKFSAVYLEEKRMLLDVLTQAHPGLIAIARSQV